MLNLNKPLEGAPGPFLLAALIFFGAVIGVSLALALMFSRVEMKDHVAGFLWGIVRAGLGGRSWRQNSGSVPNALIKCPNLVALEWR
jgi:uncharacterized membrane protein required for colicin V production